MKKKSKQMLIAAEIIGFFMILVGVLAMLRDSDLLRRLFLMLFFMIILAAVLFITFLALAVKEHRQSVEGAKKMTHLRE